MKKEQKLVILTPKLAASVGKAVAALRKNAGISQEELASRLGIGSEAVSRIERGTSLPSLTRIHAIAAALNCDAWPMLLAGTRRRGDRLMALDAAMEGLPNLSVERVLRGALNDVEFEREHMRRGKG